MSTTLSPDSQFWRAYALAVMNAIGNPTLGSDEMVFIASVVDRGINAGAIVPFPMTNRDIQNVGDVLLNVGDAHYDPSANNPYSQRLLDYLSHALPAPGDPAKLSEFESALAQDKQSQSDYRAQYGADLVLYSNDTDLGKGSFQQWAANNDTLLVQLYNIKTAADGALDQANIDYFGPDGAQLTIYRSNMRSAVDGSQLQAGMNMEASDASLEQLTQLAAQQTAGVKQAWPDPSTIYYVPVFDLDSGYAGQIDAWATSLPGNVQKSTVTMDQGSNFSMTQLGFSSSSHSDFSSPWISWGNQSSTQTSSRSYTSTNSAADVQVALSWGAISTFSIGPGGKWNVDAHSLYPKTDSTFSGVGTWGLPSQLLCASNVSLTITFSNAAQTDFDTDWQTSSQSSSGGVSIFGFHFGSNSESSSSSSVSTHNATWVGSSGVLTITPKPTNQTCTLLGVIATSVTI